MSAAGVAPQQKVRTTTLPNINRTETEPLPRGSTTPRWNRAQTKKTDTESSERCRAPTVSRGEVASFRNSLKQNICVAMLSEGFHRSFSELWSLLCCWREARLAAGPGSALWLQRPLEEQPHKMHMLHTHLTLAEAAQRRGAWAEVYDSQLFLARFFSSPEDSWLSRHFQQAGLASSRRVSLDSGRREAQACANMGRLCLEQGQLDQAREYYECFRRRALGRAWQGEDGVSLYSQACQGLCLVYGQQAQRLLLAGHDQHAVETLTLAFCTAQEAGDRKTEGEAAYRVGLAYQRIGDQQAAKKFLNMYMEVCSDLGDAAGLGKAYKAIAKSLESEGQSDEMIRYLEMFAEVSQSSNLQTNLQEACTCLGHVYTEMGQQERGCGYLERSYQLACDLGEVPLLQRAQVVLGNARAQSMARKYAGHVEAGLHRDLFILTSWKDRRDWPSIPTLNRGKEEEEEGDG
ncbi:tetratricopeptide repeat protein 29 [Osmerus mordax]|uniref:tetratricopeptide repeat protein 29 n=1 Tax=Osmerus mordax TaxID=8014 RepID=UPI00350F049A